jgi:hypothetical protein
VTLPCIYALGTIVFWAIRACNPPHDVTVVAMEEERKKLIEGNIGT